MMTFTIAAFVEILFFLFLVGGVLGAWIMTAHDWSKRK